MINAKEKVFLPNGGFMRSIALPQQESIVSKQKVEALSLILAISWRRVLILLFMVLLSALSFIYIQDCNRCLFAGYDTAQTECTKLQDENNRLLLMQSAWANQDRIRNVAQSQLDMKFPETKSIVIIDQ